MANIKYLVQQGVDINGLDRVCTTTSSSDCCLPVNTTGLANCLCGLGGLKGRFISVADVVVAFARRRIWSLGQSVKITHSRIDWRRILCAIHNSLQISPPKVQYFGSSVSGGFITGSAECPTLCMLSSSFSYSCCVSLDLCSPQLDVISGRVHPSAQSRDERKGCCGAAAAAAWS